MNIQALFMKQDLYLILCILLIHSYPSLAQLGLNGQPHPSAALDVKATNKGFLLPRLTTVQRNSIANPAIGLLVYDLDKSTLYLFDGQNWLPLAITSSNNLPPTDRVAPDGQPYDYFGYSVSISGDYAVIGAYADDIGDNFNQGSAYVFVRIGNTWTLQTKLIAPDGGSEERFGRSVAISDNYILIGAPFAKVENKADQGAAYIFVRTSDSWNFQAKLIASDGAIGDNFGYNSVSILGDYAVIGSPYSDIDTKTNQGAAYVFVRSGTTWSQQTKLTAFDGTGSFGYSTSISNFRILIGALGSVGNNFNQGSAFVFNFSGGSWNFETKLVAVDGAAFDLFGQSVFINGDYAIIGSPSDDIDNNQDQGSAYVFFRSGSSWTQQIKLLAPDGKASDKFGHSVALSGTKAIIGAPYVAVNGNLSQGAAYLFNRVGSNWTAIRKVTDNAPSNTLNGTSVSIVNGTFAIGCFQVGGNGKVGFGTIDN